MWVAKNKCGRIYIYPEKPRKGERGWYAPYPYPRVIVYKKYWSRFGLKDLKWSDPEPLEIFIHRNSVLDFSVFLDVIEKFYGKLPNREEILEYYLSKEIKYGKALDSKG